MNVPQFGNYRLAGAQYTYPHSVITHFRHYSYCHFFLVVVIYDEKLEFNERVTLIIPYPLPNFIRLILPTLVKVYMYQVRPYNSLSVVTVFETTMGGAAVHHEWDSIDVLLDHPEDLEIFSNAGWLVYFEKLQGFSE